MWRCRACPLPPRPRSPRGRRRPQRRRPSRGPRRGHRTASPICRASGRTPHTHLWSGRRTSPRSFIQRRKRSKMPNDAAEAEGEQTEPGTVADVHYDFTQFGLDRSQGGMALNLRTSLIVDPPDGRIPPMTAEGQKRAAAAGRGEKANGRRHRRRAEPAVERALHHHGPRRAADACRGVQQQLSNRSGSRIRDDSRRDDPRRPRHPAGQTSAPAAERPSVDGKLPRSLGRRDPRRRDDEFHRQDSRSRDPARTCI